MPSIRTKNNFPFLFGLVAHLLKMAKERAVRVFSVMVKERAFRFFRLSPSVKRYRKLFRSLTNHTDTRGQQAV
jgi:hypothetical protein